MQKLSKIITKRLAYSGKWIDFYLTDYSVGEKLNCNYESVERKTKRAGLEYDGVTVVPLIIKKQTPDDIKLLLIAQFRPPI